MKEKKIFEASELPDDEKVYLVKDFFGWRIVHPIRDENGKTNYMNLFFGGKKNLVILILLILIFTIQFIGTKELISNYKLIADNPCDFCENCFEQTSKIISKINNQLKEQRFNISVSDLKLPSEAVE